MPFSRHPSNRRFLARIGASSSRRQVEDRPSLGSRAAEGAPGTYSCIIEIQNDGDEPERLLGATIEGAGTGVLYKLTEKDGHFTSRPFEEGLVIQPHGSIELPPTAYQFKFGKITKALVADTMVNGTLVFEKLHSVPVEFVVEEDDTAPKEAPPLAEDGRH